MKSIRTEPHGDGAEGDERIRTAVCAPGADHVYEDRTADVGVGDRFDPFCHILDRQRRALCFADISGRPVHKRNLDSSSSAGPTHCPTCQRVICPTCLEAERSLYGAVS